MDVLREHLLSQDEYVFLLQILFRSNLPSDVVDSIVNKLGRLVDVT